MPRPHEHAIERAKQRYGVDLTMADLNEIREAILTGKSVLMGRREEFSSSTHLVKHKGVAMKAIFSDEHEIIISFADKGQNLGRKDRKASKFGRKNKYKGR